MCGVVAADTSNAALRPGRVKLHRRQAVNYPAVLVAIIGTDLSEVIDHLLRIFYSSRAALDERSQIGREPLCSLFVWIPIASLLQMPGESPIEIDNTITSQGAQAAFRAKNNDFDFTLLCSCFVYGIQRHVKSRGLYLEDFDCQIVSTQIFSRALAT
jgi:hypothetical protein